MVNFVNLADIMGRVDQAKANDQRMQMNQLLMQRQNRQFEREDAEIAQNNALKAAYKASLGEDGTFDKNALLKGVGAVAPMKAYDLSQNIAKQGREEEMYGLKKQGVELSLNEKKVSMARDALASATPETYGSIIQSLMQDPVTAKGIEGAPAEYNAEWIATSMQDADSALLNARQKAQQEFTASQNDQNRALTMRGQNISASNAAASRALTRRGQDLSAQTAIAAAQNKPRPLSQGQEQVDKDFAKEYAKNKASGGFADSQKLINQLQEASDALASDDSLTGPIVGNVPDGIRAITNPKAINTREKVEEVVQRNLREVLGAQFTQKEGDRLIARAFNPRLSTETNKRRVDALIKQMKVAAQTKQAAVEYFEQNGTLQGWGGNLPTMRDFEETLDNSPQAPSQTMLDADAILGL